MIDAAGEALAGARGVPFWLDTELRPDRRERLDGDTQVDLAIVGGGFTGLWAAVLAAEQYPARTTMLLEAADLGWAASGRNGGFCSSSLTHGLGNGLSRWPEELATLERMGRENLDAIEQTVAAHGIDCSFTRSGEITVAVAEWHLAELRELHRQARAAGVGEQLELLDAGQVRELVNSPSYLGGLRDARGTALLDPAGLVWGLAEVAERSGVRIHEQTRVQALVDEGDRIRLETSTGVIRARRVVLATNAFPSLLHRVRPYVVPVWDHVLVTEPLTAEQRAAIGWAGCEGLSDAGNQFHYYRLTADGRLLWGGYDALYYFGGDLTSKRARNEATERMLATHLFETFPQLAGVRISHTWGGAIDTCTRFTAFWQRACDTKVCAVQGYTGLGVGASRFAAEVALEILDHRDTPRTRLEMVRRRPLPFPPEPFRWAGIELTRRSIAGADARHGRRNLWLRTLDHLGMGFDS
ncbi:MAG: FAD-dependent oxidoreductase [Kineosporiaceae bacterium]|nr:FAD-dependent oxidoreductase [Kineosporiaceae bacterium]